MKRILIISPNWIGDALFTTTALRMLKETYPEADITVLAVPRAAEVFQKNPDVHDVLLNEEETRSAWYPLALIQKIGKYDFDAAFIFHRSRSRAIWTFLAGIPLRIGYNTKGRGIFLTHPVKQPPSEKHRIESLQYLLNQIGIKGKAGPPIYVPSGIAKDWVTHLLRDKHYVVLNPGGNWPPKRWPIERFAQMADRLTTELGLHVVVTGSAKDRELAYAIQERTTSRIINLVGQTDIEGLAALIQASRLFIGNDTGPMHLAAAMGTPLIALFGPTSAKITGPVGTGPIRVLQKDIGLPVPNPNPSMRDMRYMEAITVEEVFQAAAELLGQPITV
jgi:heptosyltransferase II